MKSVMLLSLVIALEAVADAQAPATRKPAATAAARSGMAITVTDARGGTIPGVTVEAAGPTPRNGVTDGGGQINFPGLQAGTYRLRFSGDAVTAFEKEVAVRAGQIADLDIVLTPAPPPKEVPVAAPAPPPAPAVGPAGQPQVVSIVDLVERELITNNAPRKDTLVSCSGNTRTMLVQLNQPQAKRVYQGAESSYYVVAGEGTVTIADKDVPLAAGGYVAIPRGTAHSLARRGRRPFVLLATLSGEACEEAR